MGYPRPLSVTGTSNSQDPFWQEPWAQVIICRVTGSQRLLINGLRDTWEITYQVSRGHGSNGYTWVNIVTTPPTIWPLGWPLSEPCMGMMLPLLQTGYLAIPGPPRPRSGFRRVKISSRFSRRTYSLLIINKIYMQTGTELSAFLRWETSFIYASILTNSHLLKIKEQKKSNLVSLVHTR